MRTVLPLVLKALRLCREAGVRVPLTPFKRAATTGMARDAMRRTRGKYKYKCVAENDGERELGVGSELLGEPESLV